MSIRIGRKLSASAPPGREPGTLAGDPGVDPRSGAGHPAGARGRRLLHGLLHHTGDMSGDSQTRLLWCAPAGAVCDRDLQPGRGSLARFRALAANQARLQPRFGVKRRAMLTAYESYWFAQQLRHRRNPLRVASKYRRSRGMARRDRSSRLARGLPVRVCVERRGDRILRAGAGPADGQDGARGGRRDRQQPVRLRQAVNPVTFRPRRDSGRLSLGLRPDLRAAARERRCRRPRRALRASGRGRCRGT